jgi:lactose/L-arabinose transport system ATP-binding protein
MRLEIAKLHKELGATMIYVTHDQVEAMTLADKIVVLRSGRVEQVGSPLALYDDPDNAFVAGFIGSPRMNFLPAVVESSEDEVLTVRLTDLGDVTVPMRVKGQHPARGYGLYLASARNILIRSRGQDRDAGRCHRASWGDRHSPIPVRRWSNL